MAAGAMIASHPQPPRPGFCRSATARADPYPVPTLAVILARAGSKGLPGKNVADLAGRPLIAHTIDDALAAHCVDHVVVSTDGHAIAEVARRMGVDVIDRPAQLAGDTATVDSAARHAVQIAEFRPPLPLGEGRGEGCARQTCGCHSGDSESSRNASVGAKTSASRANPHPAASQPTSPKGRGEGAFDSIVILYGNVPLRPNDLIDRAVTKLADTGADSVQSVCTVGKMHPYWMKRVGDDDALLMYEDNHVYRRQDLPPVYMLDGGIIAVTRRSLFTIVEGEPHAFLGRDRRAVVTQPGEVVDIDTELDLIVARAMIERAATSASPTTMRDCG